MVALNLSVSAAALPAFPGAEGYGQSSKGGRGGQIIAVTNLNDSGPGSFRACVTAKGPRVCIFRVSGVIRFTTERPIIRNPYLTIAGQTAPGGGIVLTHAGGASAFTPLVIKETHDIVIRHIRVRPDRVGGERESNSAFIIQRGSNVILDHVSGSWARDENMGNTGHNDNITVSWSIFAEGIPRHDKCALLGSNPGQPQHYSFIRNICAHNGDRNPDVNFAPKSCVDVLNNVLYNAKVEFTEIWESYGGTPVNLLGNYYKTGPNTSPNAAAVTRQTIGALGVARIYMADNVLDGAMTLHTPTIVGRLVTEPVCPPITRPVSAVQAYKDALSWSGAFPRDSFDSRIVEEVKTRTGRIVKTPGVIPEMAPGTPYKDSDGDGMSDAWEISNGLNPRVNDAWGDKNRNGWLNLDEFLNYAHQQVMAGRAVQ